MTNQVHIDFKTCSMLRCMPPRPPVAASAAAGLCEIIAHLPGKEKRQKHLHVPQALGIMGAYTNDSHIEKKKVKGFQMAFQFHMPVTVVFEVDAIKRLNDLLRQ